MTVAVRAVGGYILGLRTRMPFRYGIATMTEVPHAFVYVDLDVDGRRCRGLAADSLPPKWFTKDPETTVEDDLTDMLTTIKSALARAEQVGDAESVFDLWWAVYQSQARWGANQGFPPLLWAFGVCLVERAMIDAYCRATAMPFGVAVRSGALGSKLGAIYPELAGSKPAELLPAAPLRSIDIRHTVGLSDPITEQDINSDGRIGDGLPQSLQACIRTYKLRRFKIKVSGEAAHDRRRLAQLASLLEADAPAETTITLDGNEQYEHIDQFAAFWASLRADPQLRRLTDRTLFVEQPIHRSVALEPDIAQAIAGWADRPPIIIDESDGEIDTLASALAAGYSGTSHKNCKGVFKGLANASLISHRTQRHSQRSHILSGEDLATIGPISLNQDLTVLANLGINHAERNGHHYFTGLSMMPRETQQAVLTHHHDLYHEHACGYPTLTIDRGAITIDSLISAPFGTAFYPNLDGLTPLEDWRPTR